MKYLLVFSGLLIYSCSSTSEGNENNVKQKDTSITLNSVANITEVVTPIRRYAEGLEDFSNIEWIEYCLPLPVHEYPETFEQEDKGQHTFGKKEDKDSYIIVECLGIEDSSLSLKEYYHNIYPSDNDLEAEGKIITTREFKENTQCFYIQGYWSNKIHESRFLEMTWLRNDGVVKLEAHYPVADTTKWKGFIVSWLTVDSQCH